MAKEMKRCFGLMVALVLLLSSGAGVTGALATTTETDLVLNPSFETLDTAGTACREWGMQTAEVVKPSDTGYIESPDGGNYVYLPTKNTAVTQTIGETLPEGNYLFSVYVKYKRTDANIGAGLTLRLGTQEKMPQSASNNYEIYNTRGEWRRVTYPISVPAENEGLTIELRHMGNQAEGLCFDGISLVRTGAYDADALIQYSMDDVSTYNGVSVPTELIPFSEDGEKTYGTLGTNYKATADTRNGEGYAMEMVNTGEGADASLPNDGTYGSLDLLFYTGFVHAQATYEISGWINVDSESGYVKLDNRRIKPNGGNLHSTKSFYDTNGWKHFAFKVRPYVDPLEKYNGNSYYTETFNYTVQFKLFGVGSAKLDDICIRRVLDENHIGYHKNVIPGGDFESIAEVDASGVFKPDTSLWKANALSWVNDTAASGAMLETETVGTAQNTYLRYTQNMSDSSLSWMQLDDSQLIPGKLYCLAFKMRYSVFEAGTEGKFRTPKLNIKFELPKVEYSSEIKHPLVESYKEFTEPSKTEDWTTYTIYFRYPENANPQRSRILFRPYSYKSANFDWTIAVDLDDVSLCMLQDGEAYGTVTFTEDASAGTATASRALFHDGKTDEDLKTAREYWCITAAYAIDGTTRSLHDVQIEKKTASMGTESEKMFALETPVSQTVSVPEGTYEVETYLWNSVSGLVPLETKTVMQAE